MSLSLDELAAEIFIRGWVFEIIAMGATYEAAPIPRMTAQAYIGRIMTPNGEIEWGDRTPQSALAGALTEAVENPGSAR
jgi:hypothetical protein